MNELMRQAQRMQRKMDEIRDQLRDHEITAGVAGDRVRVTVTCEGKVRKIEVAEDFAASEDLDLLLDTVVAATNKALETADAHVDAALDKVTGGVKMPNLG